MTTPSTQPKEFDHTLSSLQNQLLSRSLLVLMAVTVLGLSHVLTTGWKMMYYSYLLIAASALGSWLWREKLSPRPLAAALVILICCYATATLMGLGLATAGLPVFFAAAVICVLIFGNHTTLVLAVIGVLAFVFSGVMFQQLSSPVSQAPITQASMTMPQYVGWAAVIVSSLLFIPVIADYISGLRKTLQQQVENAQQEAEKSKPQYDPLTGLPLLPVSIDRLRHELNRAKRNGTLGSVMFIDVDHFQQLNTRYGSEGGNMVLRTLAARIASIVRASDTLCRIGGDSFIAIFADQHTDEQIRLIARKLLATVNNPITYKQDSIDIQVSIGVAIFPEHSVDPRELISLASAAVERVKQSGGDNYRLSSTEL